MSHSDNYIDQLKAQMPFREVPPLLNDAELQYLILAYSASVYPNGITDEDTANLLAWCQNTLKATRALTCVLQGLAIIRWNTTEAEPYFILTTKGKEYLDQAADEEAAKFLSNIKGLIDEE